MREFLKCLRKERKLTQVEISKRMGISQQYYNMIETGERNERMSLETAMNIAKVLDLEPLDFIKREWEWEQSQAKEGE